jgi:methanogenic corrinoid protein MtbC1
MGVGSFTEELESQGCWETLEPDAFVRVTDSQLTEQSVQSTSSQRRARLLRTVEGDIIPRLLLAGRAARQEAGVPEAHAAPAVAEDDISELVRLLLEHDTSVALAFVEAIRKRGPGIDSICLELLTPAARRLGELWDQDLCTFMQVTVGLSRLHGVLRELNPAFRSPGATDSRDRGRRALLMPTPGEQHTFGLLMVGEFLRRAGWEVWTDFPGTQAELATVVAGHWFAVAGFSLGSEARLDTLSASIQALRRASRNRSIGVMVGGPIFLAHPEYVNRVGADTAAADARDAAVRADNVFNLLAAAN